MTAGSTPVVGQLIGVFLPRTANWLYEQMRAARAHSVVLAKTRDRPDEFPWDRIYSLDAGSPFRKLANRASRRVLGHYPDWERAARAERVALLHAHFGPMGLHGRTLARKLGVPLLTSFYGVDMWKHKQGEAGLRERYRVLFEEGTGFVVEGPAAGERLAFLGCPPEKIHVHRLGVELAAIPFVQRRPARSEPLRVLMAARFTEKKGIPFGVEAFCRLASANEAMRLTLVGGPDDSPAEQGIAREVHGILASHGVASRVSLPGMLDRPALGALYAEHDVFLHPSVRAADGDAEGGHPVVITEAAASGLPTIATTHCDIPEIVHHGETGWLCPERDVGSIVEALSAAAADRERLARYGAQARQLVEERYDISKERWDRLYRAVLPQQ